MSFALIQTSDNTWLAGPLDARPVPTDGQHVIEVAQGYPTACEWRAVVGGFVDRNPEPPTQCAALIALLVSKGVLSASEAAALFV